MWSQEYSNLLAIKFDFSTLIDIESASQERIISDLQTIYNLQVQHNNFVENVLRFTLQLSSKLQSAELFHNLQYPTKDVVFGIIAYEVEEAGVAAVKLAANMVQKILNNQKAINIEEAISEISAITNLYQNGISSSIIIDAAIMRNIPISKGPAGYTILGYGNKQKKISAAMSQNTSCIGVNIAGNKDYTKKFLEDAHILVPKGIIVRDENDLADVAKRLGFPLVTKPFNGNQGRNISCGITNLEQLLAGFKFAKEISRAVIIEKEISGQDYRLLVIDNKFCAASLRLAAAVFGDGVSTIGELVASENKNPKRGRGHDNILTKITLDAATDVFLKSRGLTVNSVPASGEQVYLKQTANLSTGGTAEDVTALVHPTTKYLAEKASKVIGLDICGIDIVTPDISQPLAEGFGAIIEVNAAPGLRMHKYPSSGISREVGVPIVDSMFKNNEDGRIPIVAITGTNGKTTTTRLMAHVASFAGNVVGFSSTDGIYVDGQKIQSGDCSGPQSTRTILLDVYTDFAVLECARGGIIRAGLGFDQCDIAIVTNVAADHLGLKDINTVEELARVKAVVPQSVKKEGWAILNACNEHTMEMKSSVKSNVALFSINEFDENFQNHINNAGSGVYATNNLDIFINHENAKTFVTNAKDVPITRNGKASFMTENVLPVVLAAYLSDISVNQIAEALKCFIPSAEHTPGRINEFVINDVNLILDYAHNPHGLNALASYLINIPEQKVGIITGTGNRRDEDIVEFGRISASMYDEIIIRFDRDLRGRTQESIIELLVQGLHQIKPNLDYQIIPDLQTAVEYAINTADKNSYVVLCADNATYTVDLIKKIQLKYG